jgi:hypothetical protein
VYCDIYSHSGGIYRISGKLGITCRDSLVLTVAVLTYASASFGRAAILAASARLTRDRSPLTRQTQRAHDHTRVSGNTTRAQPCSGIGASLGARALCALLGRAPLLTSLRASLGRFKRSRASSGSVRMPAAHRRSQGRHRGARRKAPPRSALRASLGHPHLAPRSARRSGASNAAGPAVAAYDRQPAAHRRSQGRHRGARRKAPPRSALRASLGRPLGSSPRSALRASLGTHGPTSAPRSWRRAWGAGAPRWRAKAAALRGNLMAPERLARGARAPNGLHRSTRRNSSARARRQWRTHASPGAKVRKCHDGAWNTLAKNFLLSSVF